MRKLCKDCRDKEWEKVLKGYTSCIVFERVDSKEDCDFCKGVKK